MDLFGIYTNILNLFPNYMIVATENNADCMTWRFNMEVDNSRYGIEPIRRELNILFNILVCFQDKTDLWNVNLYIFKSICVESNC